MREKTPFATSRFLVPLLVVLFGTQSFYFGIAIGETHIIPFNAGTGEFLESFAVALPDLIDWDTGDLLIAQFGTEQNPIRAQIGTIVGEKDAVVIPKVFYPNGELLFDGVTQDTRSGLRLDAELYGRAGIQAGATLALGTIDGMLKFNTGPSLILPEELRAGRFFRMAGKSAGIQSSSELNVSAPQLDFRLDLILDIDARGTLEVGLYPFAPYQIGDFYLPNLIPDIDLCGLLTTDSGVSLCGGDPNNDTLLTQAITLPKPKVPAGAPDPPIIQVGEFQIVNPAKALVSSKTIDTVRNVLVRSGETDLVRLAADIDGIIGGFTLGTSEFTGGSRKIPNNDNFIAELKYDLIDVKYGPEFGYSFDASLDTDLRVTLTFSSKVLIQNPNGTITDETSWTGKWDAIPAIALPSASPVDVDVDFTDLDAEFLYESRFTLADYMELTALELQLKMNFAQLGLGPVATQALKSALKLPSLGPLYYNKFSILGETQFDDLPAIDLTLLDLDLKDGGTFEDLWDGAFQLIPAPITELYLSSDTASLQSSSSYLKFGSPPVTPTAGEVNNGAIVLGVAAEGSDPESRYDLIPIRYGDAGGSRTIQGLHLPEGSSLELFPDATRDFVGLTLIENDGDISGGRTQGPGTRLSFTSPSLLSLTGNGEIRFNATTTNQIIAPIFFHGEGHRLLFQSSTGLLRSTTSLTNSGQIEAENLENLLIIDSPTITNGATGQIKASLGGWITLDGAVQNEGLVLANGAASRVTILGTVNGPDAEGPESEGPGNFVAESGGEIQFDGNFFTNLGGNLAIEARAGGLVNFEDGIVVLADGVVELITQPGGSMTLRGLALSNCTACSVEKDGRAIITNRGELNITAGKNSLRVPSGQLAEDFDDQIVPIDLENTGTIRIFEGAELALDISIENYSGNGTNFAGGTWELIGAEELFDNRSLKPGFFGPQQPTWAILDLQVGEVVRNVNLLEETLPLDELTTALKFNSANVVLSGAALFPYFNTVAVNRGSITLDRLQQFYTAGSFENDGGVTNVLGGAGLYVAGPLLVNGGTISVTGSGSTLEVSGGHFLTEDDQLARRDIEINGGTLSIDIAANFDFTSGGRTWVVRDRLQSDGNGGEQSVPGVFDLGGRQIVVNTNAITIEGSNASFEAARTISINAGSVSLGRGHRFESLASRFDNLAGATLSLVGAQFLLPGDFSNYGDLVVDENSRLQADQLTLYAGTAQLMGLIEAETLVGAGATLRGSGMYAYDLTMAPSSRLEIEFSGPEVMGVADVEGTLSIETPESYIPLEQPGEMMVYSLLTAEQIVGSFESLFFDNLLLAQDFGTGDSLQEDLGNGYFRTINFLETAIELVEFIAPEANSGGSPVVDLGDFRAWHLNRSNEQVPEPSSWLLLTLAVTGCLLAWRPKRAVHATANVPVGAPGGTLFHPSLVLLVAFTALTSTTKAIPFDWDGDGNDNAWDTQANWNPQTGLPGSGDFLLLTGSLTAGPQTIDLGGVEREVVRIENKAGGLTDGSYTFENGTVELFLTIGNSLLTRNAGGPLTVNADILFAAIATDPRFNVEPSAPPIFVSGNVAPAATNGTVTLELTSRNLTLEPSVDVSGVIADGPGSTLALTAGFGPDSENHRGTVRVTGLNTYTGPTIVNGAILEFNSIANADGTPSALGAPDEALNPGSGLIRLGASDTNGVRVPGTLRYLGAGSSSDRPLFLPAASDGATIESSGSGPLTLSGGITGASSTGLKTLTLGGSNGEENRFDGVIGAIPGSASLGLLKTGPGHWVLTQANTYQSFTAVQQGKLTIRGGTVNGNSGSLGDPAGVEPAQLDIEQGSTVNFGALLVANMAGNNKFNTVNVSGAGSILSVSDIISVGNVGLGSMNLLLGGSASTGGLEVADALGSFGSVNIVGSGSQLSVVDSTAQIGFGGFGQVGITGGGYFQSDRNMTLGWDTNAVGTVTVSGSSGPSASTLEVGRLLRVGNQGNGTINITGGAQLLTSTAGNFPVFIGNESSGNGAVLVSGAQSQWIHQGTGAGNGIFVGNSGGDETASRRLEVLAGATVQTEEFLIANSSLSQGNTTIGGAGSAIVASGFVSVGRQGVGTLEIRSGGSLQAGGDLEIGSRDKGDGQLLVQGSTSSLELLANLTVGREGKGQLTVEAGSMISVAGTMNVATTGGSTGTVNVTGTTVDVGDTVTIGNGPLVSGVNANGRLTITQGGQFNMNNSAGSIDIQANLFADGHVTVGDSDLMLAVSRLTSANSLNLGKAGNTNADGGTLTVRPTGEVHVVSTLKIDTTGTLILNGGLVEAAAFDITDRFGIQFNSGTIRVLGDETLDASSLEKYGLALSEGFRTLTEEQHLDIVGAATLSDPLQLDGGTFSVGSTSDLSQLQFAFGSAQSGTLRLTNSGLQVGTSGLLGDELRIAANQGLEVAQTLAVAAEGTLAIEGGTLAVDTLDLSQGGAFSFASGRLQVAQVQGNLSVDGGKLALGYPQQGLTTVSGDYQQTAGILEIDLGGPAVGEFDQLSVTGTATLGGSLQFAPLLDYQGPSVRGEGHPFQVLSADTIVGTFDAITYNGIELLEANNYVGLRDDETDGLFANLTETEDQIVLTTYLAEIGDTDGDGVVGATDLATILSNFGAAGDFSTGDLDQSGSVNGGDFLLWQRNANSAGNGLAVSNANSSTAIPEPSSLMLVCGCAWLLFSRENNTTVHY